MNTTLMRDYLGRDCTVGKLAISGESFDTMERPWVPTTDAPCGRKGVSCVPAGTYQLVRHNSEAHPNTFALVNPDLWVYHWDNQVPAHQLGVARTLVLIHVANWASELRGCIAPGLGRSIDPEGRRMVTSSGAAMRKIQKLLPFAESHTLEIIEPESSQ